MLSMSTMNKLSFHFCNPYQQTLIEIDGSENGHFKFSLQLLKCQCLIKTQLPLVSYFSPHLKNKVTTLKTFVIFCDTYMYDLDGLSHPKITKKDSNRYMYMTCQ